MTQGLVGGQSLGEVVGSSQQVSLRKMGWKRREGHYAELVYATLRNNVPSE